MSPATLDRNRLLQHLSLAGTFPGAPEFCNDQQPFPVPTATAMVFSGHPGLRLRQPLPRRASDDELWTPSDYFASPFDPAAPIASPCLGSAGSAFCFGTGQNLGSQRGRYGPDRILGRIGRGLFWGSIKVSGWPP